jgi:hypothetical protein
LRLCLPLICVLFALPGEAADTLADVLACRAISDSRARLACFDRETAALASAPAASLAAAPAIAAPAAAPAASIPSAAAPPTRNAPVLDPQQSFGLSGSAIATHEEASGARPPKVSKIEARIVALALTGNGRTLFTLDNTQVWRQLESDGDMLAKLGDAATISRGLLGSYWLQLKSGRGCKVARVR